MNQERETRQQHRLQATLAGRQVEGPPAKRIDLSAGSGGDGEVGQVVAPERVDLTGNSDGDVEDGRVAIPEQGVRVRYDARASAELVTTNDGLL